MPKQRTNTEILDMLTDADGRELFEGGYLTRNIDGTDYRATPFNAGKLDAQV